MACNKIVKKHHGDYYYCGLSFFGTIINIDAVDFGNLKPNPPTFSAADNKDNELKMFQILQQWVTQEYGDNIYIGGFFQDVEEVVRITVYLAIPLPSKQTLSNLAVFFQDISYERMCFFQEDESKSTKYYNLLKLLNQEMKEPELQNYISMSHCQYSLNMVPEAFKCSCCQDTEEWYIVN